MVALTCWLVLEEAVADAKSSFPLARGTSRLGMVLLPLSKNLGVILCFVVLMLLMTPLVSLYLLLLLAVVVGFRGVLLGYYLFLF